MRSSTSTRLWQWTSFISVLSFLIFLGGFLIALNPHWVNSAAPQPAPEEMIETPATEGQINLVALGDSLTRGTGDAEGLGYLGRLREKLEQKQEQTVKVTNLAINGQQSPDLLTQLDQTNVRKLVREADILLFTIGGNDLFRQTEGIFELDTEKIDSTIEILSVNFERVLAELRELNPIAPIIYTGLYNPFGDTPATRELAAPIQSWNYKANQIALKFSNVSVVPTYDLFFQKESSYLYTDHFHPNNEGYKRIAERVFQAYQ